MQQNSVAEFNSSLLELMRTIKMKGNIFQDKIPLNFTEVRIFFNLRAQG